jgi:excisionase family DNA binding protein
MVAGYAYICIYSAVAKKLGEKAFYSASEVAEMAGIHRLTLLRWIREGKLADVQRDRNGWRLFSKEITEQIVDYAQGLDPHSSPNQGVLFPRKSTRIIATSQKSVRDDP